MAIQFDNSGFNLVASTLGGFLMFYGALSYMVKERLFLGEAPLAVIVGIVLDRSGAIPLAYRETPGSKEDPLDHFALLLSRLVIGVQLVIVGIQLPHKYPWLEIKSLSVLLLPVMICMWLITTGLTMLCIPNVPLLVGLVVASASVPTDPVLSNAIVKGSFADQHVSPRLRNLISAESGVNDGFGYPFLYLAVHLLKSATTAEALKTWALEVILYQVVGAVVFGSIIGTAAKYILHYSTRCNLIDKESFLCYGIAVGIFTVGAAGYLDLDDLLAAFAVGNALTWDDWYREETEEDELQNVMDLLLNTVFFMFVGATIPWAAMNDPENGITPLRLLGLAVLVLLLRRLPAMLIFRPLVPLLQKSWTEAAFMGYFGPIGAGALFYASLIMDEFRHGGDTEPVELRQIRMLAKPVTYALVLSSLIGHTLMIPILKGILTWRDVGNVKLTGEEDESAEQEREDESELDDEYEAGERLDHDEEGTRRLRAGSVMSNAPGAAPASVASRTEEQQGGAFQRDGRWDPNASWKRSSAHLPTSSHKLGPHVASEQLRQQDGPILPERWQRRVNDLEQGRDQRNRSTPDESRHFRSQLRPKIDDHRRQSAI